MKPDLEQLENKGRLNMFQTAFVFSCIRPLFKDMLLVLLKNKKEYYTKVTKPEIIKTFNNIEQLELNEKMSQLNNKFALVPLNTEAKYFILNHDNTYQITKITEIPDCKYIAPIIGTLE